jgi:adenosylmethionine-8-amino-7-oxononanoate aminotransferase
LWNVVAQSVPVLLDPSRIGAAHHGGFAMLTLERGNFLRANSVKHVWHPMAHPNEMDRMPPRIFVKGEGVHIVDADGNRVLDACGGLWNVNLGYSNAAVKAAIARQLDGCRSTHRFAATPIRG